MLSSKLCPLMSNQNRVHLCQKKPVSTKIKTEQSSFTSKRFSELIHIFLFLFLLNGNIGSRSPKITFVVATISFAIQFLSHVVIKVNSYKTSSCHFTYILSFQILERKRLKSLCNGWQIWRMYDNLRISSKFTE